MNFLCFFACWKFHFSVNWKLILILYCTVCWNTWLINSSIKPFWLCGLSNWLVCITFVVQTLMWKIQNSIYCNLQSLLRNLKHDTIQVLVSLNDDFQNYLHININTYIYVCALDNMGGPLQYTNKRSNKNFSM